MKSYDILIVGAGPSGATLARELDGIYNTLLVDKRDFNKDNTKNTKNCGGLIAPDAQKVLASFDLSIPKDLLVSPQMFYVKTIDFDNNIIKNYQRHYINVNRQRYDKWLISLIGKYTTQMYNTRFKNAIKEKDKYNITLKQNNKIINVYAKIIIDATGANSIVKNKLLPKQKNNCKKYVSIQQWYKNTTNTNQFVAIFDEKISDFYSWIIPEDDYLIFGSAIQEGKDGQKYHNLQKEKLKKYGFDFSNPIKKEACILLRPKSKKDIYLGENNIALLGEAAGFISPTSAEGISYAMKSTYFLSKALKKDISNFMYWYEKYSKPLKSNISIKMLKYPIMYNKHLRNIILKLNIGTIKIKNNQS